MDFLTNLTIKTKIIFSSNNKSDCEKLCEENKEKQNHTHFSTKDKRSKYPESNVPYAKKEDQKRYK